jgi:hypothetical protein
VQVRGLSAALAIRAIDSAALLARDEFPDPSGETGQGPDRLAGRPAPAYDRSV